MKLQNKESLKKAGYTFGIVAACILFYFLVERFSGFAAVLARIAGIVRPFVFGIVIAYLLMPVSDWMVKLFSRMSGEKDPEKLPGKKKRRFTTISIFLSIILFVVLIIALTNLVVPQMIESVASVVQAIPQAIDSAQTAIGEILAGDPELAAAAEQNLEKLYADSMTFLEDNLTAAIGSAIGGISGGVMNAFSVFKDLLIGLIVAVNVMGSRSIFRRQARMIVYSLFPYKWEEPAREEQTADMIFREAGILNSYMNGFIKGKILDSFIIGVICLAAMLLLRMPYPVLISVIVGVTNVIPFFGPFIGAIPSALIILMTDPVQMVIFVIFIVILQQIDGNVIGPSILGNATNLSSFWVLFAILFFGGLFGIPGMILGVPVFGFFYQLIRELVLKKIRKEQENLKEHAQQAEGTALAKEKF